MIRRPLIWLLFALLALGSSVTAQQLFTRQLNLAQLAERAEFIVHGRVVDARQMPHPDYPNIIVRKVTVAVLTNVRGAPVRVFTFLEYVDRPRIRRPSRGESFSPNKARDNAYRPGHEVVVFLYARSRYGLTSPVGAQQGSFRVLQDRSGRKAVVNGVNNAGVFDNVAAAAQIDAMKLSVAEQSLTTVESGPVDLKAFLALVTRFASRRAK
jgi:hypothetical protein